MNFLGIDLGTTGCKAVLFDENGQNISSDYREYSIRGDVPGHAELDPLEVWNYIKLMVKGCVSGNKKTVDAISVSSLGEAVVPVSRNRQPLFNSLLNFDSRGGDYIPWLQEVISDYDLYAVNGNPVAPNYGLTKLLWYMREKPELYEKAYKFLPWGSFVLFMMGAEPIVDYGLANRTLLLDINNKCWNSSLLNTIGFSLEKLPDLAEAGSVCGKLSDELALELGLENQPLLVTGTHDQCANPLGCGVLDPGTAMYGMGTFHCIVSVFKERGNIKEMISRGLNTEHHAVPDRWVSFIYNQGGILLKWLRDTFASESLNSKGGNVYSKLLSEMPAGPSSVSVLPHFTTTGPPFFLEKTTGMIAGLTIDTTRGDICKGVLEGIAFYLKENLDNLPSHMEINDFRVVGGGSRSDLWMQLTADILESPCLRMAETEAGSLGAAILASYGSGFYKSLREAVENMVMAGREFLPDKTRTVLYYPGFERYKGIYPQFGNFLADYK